jgi:hypothetical protein
MKAGRLLLALSLLVIGLYTLGSATVFHWIPIHAEEVGELCVAASIFMVGGGVLLERWMRD